MQIWISCQEERIMYPTQLPNFTKAISVKRKERLPKRRTWTLSYHRQTSEFVKIISYFAARKEIPITFDYIATRHVCSLVKHLLPNSWQKTCKITLMHACCIYLPFSDVISDFFNSTLPVAQGKGQVRQAKGYLQY